MNLREERNQDKQTWRTHFEQERLDLSASVEAALIDDGVLAQPWQDELDEQTGPQPVINGTGIVSPRLSLQSKVLPAAQPEQSVKATTDSRQVISSYSEEEAEQKSSGMLARLARRFTSTFAAVKPEAPQQQGVVSASERSLTQERNAHQSMPDHGQISASTGYSDVPLVRVIDTTPSLASIVEAPSLQATPRGYNALKRNGKVRLETTEQPALSKASLSPKVEDQETGEALLAADVKEAVSQYYASPAIPEQREEYNSPAPRVSPVIPAWKEEHNSPAPHVSSSATYRSLAGSGAFESEQGEVMIVNACITASSVVLVTLTANPGPVVVQYISLQPDAGFTVHLTAPVVARTTFNYVIVQADAQ